MSNLDEVFLGEEEFFLKNLTLTTEFNKYLVEHPEVAEELPQRGAIVVLPEDDPLFCRKVMELVQHHQRMDDVEERSIVYVKVKRLVPAPRSRLVDPRVEVAVC